MRILFIVLRILIAAAIIAAIVGQLITSFGYWNSQGVVHTSVTVTNFFSFFTIDSNVFTVAIGLIGAALLIAGRMPDPRWFLVSRASVTAYMVVTGVVYNLLLRGIELPQGTTLVWSNEVLHVIGPAYMLLDWLFAPGRRPLPWRTIWLMVAFPIVWAIYTLIRAPLVHDEVLKADHWYPYPFLNPNLAPEGYWSVAFYIALISGIIIAAGAGVVWVSRRWHRGLALEPAAASTTS